MEPTQPQPTEQPTPTGSGTLPPPVQNALDAVESALQQAVQHLEAVKQQVAQHL